MPRRDYVPQGVIPAVLLPFHEDLSIDEAAYRAHLRDVASVEGVAAITTNAHASEVASCSFDEQRRVLELTQEENGRAPADRERHLRRRLARGPAPGEDGGSRRRLGAARLSL